MAQDMVVTPLIQELRDIQKDLNSFVDEATATEMMAPLNALEESAKQVGLAWSRSWLGYQANVYYKEFKPLPPNVVFDTLRGLGFPYMSPQSTSEWGIFDPAKLIQHIEDQAKNPDIRPITRCSLKGQDLFNTKRDQVVSILEIFLARRPDAHLAGILTEAKNLKLVSETDVVNGSRPVKMPLSNDDVAMRQGVSTPPHITVLAKVISLREPSTENQRLAEIARRAADHLERMDKSDMFPANNGSKVFIGHGHSLIWMKLKDFINDDLKLPYDEFNRVPTPGHTNIERLTEMLNSAGFAFLVMTGEDERKDGKVLARMNVIHESGLFQGKLGFSRAIILLEEGCEGFSNIDGLETIRFPKENIKASFDEVRKVLKREGFQPSA